MPYFPDNEPFSTVTASIAFDVQGPPSGSAYGLTVRPIEQSVSGTFSTVARTTAQVVIAQGNPERLMLEIYNDAGSPLFLRLAPSGSGLSTDYTIKMGNNSYFELPKPVYTGEISGYWGSNGVGSARVTEHT